MQADDIYWTTEVRKTETVMSCAITGSTAVGEHPEPESLRREPADFQAAGNAKRRDRA